MRKFFWINCLLTLFIYGNAQKEHYNFFIDSLKKEVRISKCDTCKIKLLNALSYTYSKFNYEEGIKFAEQAEMLAIRVDWKKGIADSDLDLGLNNVGKCDYVKALQYYTKSIELYKEIGCKQGMGSVYANIGLLYLAKSDYSRALENDYKALSILEELSNIHLKAVVLENIGTAYLEQKKYSKTLGYYALALKDYKKINDKQGISRNLGNQGIILNDLGDYAKALNYHLLALKTSRETGDQESIQINLANVGITYSYLKKFPMALMYHIRALDLSRKLKDNRSIAINLGNTGELYYYMAKDTLAANNRTENLKKAISYLNGAITACKEIGFKGPYIEFCKFLSDVYILSQDYKKALETFKEYSSIKDTVFSQETRLQINALETNRQMNIKSKDVVLKDRQIQIEKLQLKNKNNERVIFLVSIGMLFVTIFLLYRLFRLRSKSHKRVLSDIANIHAHEIRGPVARILGLAQLFDQDNPAACINKQVVNFMNVSALELDNVIKRTVNRVSK
jgi:tetratricopeptide (TPR) repeat protein